MRFKRMTEIYSRLVDYTITNTEDINDFTVGSAMRAIYEAVSIELEQYYVLTRENVAEAIEKGVYSSFGFEQKKAVKAYGAVQISFHNPAQQALLIPRGSTFTSNQSSYSQVYETLEDYRIPQGAILVEVDVYCQVPGEVGNVPAGVINIMRTPLPNIKSVSNPAAFQTGQDKEPTEELRSRFQAFINALSRATIPALEYGTREVPEVAGVYIDEQVGLVTIYAHDRNGNLPELLKTKIENNLINYRPAGISVVVKPVTKKTIDIEVTLTLNNKAAITETFRTKIQNDITRYLNNMSTSQDLILSDLTRVIMNIDKQLIYDVHFKNLSDNIDIKGSEVIRSGEVKVTLN